MSAKSKKLARDDSNFHQWERKQPRGTRGGWICKRCGLTASCQSKPYPNDLVSVPIGNGEIDQITCDEGVVAKLMDS